MTTTKMSPEVKAEWLTALRSGEFEQGTGQLCSAEGKYCCLGVLSELAARRGVTEAYVNLTADRKEYGSTLDWLLTPPEAMVWAGLDDANPCMPGHALSEEQLARIGFLADEDYSVAELNDAGLTFAEIADLIEVHL